MLHCSTLRRTEELHKLTMASVFFTSKILSQKDVLIAWSLFLDYESIANSNNVESRASFRDTEIKTRCETSRDPSTRATRRLGNRVTHLEKLRITVDNLRLEIYFSAANTCFIKHVQGSLSHRCHLKHTVNIERKIRISKGGDDVDVYFRSVYFLPIKINYNSVAN